MWFVAVLEFDRKNTGEPGQLGREIIKKRFESYNRVWLLNNGMGGADNVGTITNHMTGDRLRSSYEEEVNMTNSAQYFNDKVPPALGSSNNQNIYLCFLFLFIADGQFDGLA